MRHSGRDPGALRSVTIELGWHRPSEGSVLYRAEGTVVLCTASVDEGVKDFLRGSGRGWVTAEYVMHPRASGRRQARDGFNGRPLSGRAHEISRLVGRSLRGAVDARVLGERTITIDCDVIEADGGTRTASVTGGMVALVAALDAMRKRGLLQGRPLRSLVAAVSAGIVAGTPMLDLTYIEDRDAQMDLNLVANEAGEIVELQATAEGAPVLRSKVDQLTDMALSGVARLVSEQIRAIEAAGIDLSALRTS